MRFAAALSRAVLWLATALALTVAIPAAWLQLNVVDADGYAALARRAAADPSLQSAIAAELTTRAMGLIAAHGGSRYPVDASQVRDAARAFTASPAFPPLFAQANREVHGWLFGEPGSGGEQLAIDVAPMLNDSSIQPLLRRHNVAVPAKLTVPVTVSSPSVRQGRLSPLADWGPWLSVGAVVVAGVCAALTLLAARRRGKALSSLGVCALLVGAAGWAALEIVGRRVGAALNRTTGDVRRIAEVMVGTAEAGAHHWLNVTLVAGAALAAAGVLVAVLAGLVRSPGG